MIGNLVIFIAAALRILPRLSAFCRAKSLKLLIWLVLKRTLDLSIGVRVPASQPLISSTFLESSGLLKSFRLRIVAKSRVVKFIRDDTFAMESGDHYGNGYLDRAVLATLKPLITGPRECCQNLPFVKRWKTFVLQAVIGLRWPLERRPIGQFHYRSLSRASQSPPTTALQALDAGVAKLWRRAYRRRNRATAFLVQPVVAGSNIRVRERNVERRLLYGVESGRKNVASPPVRNVRPLFSMIAATVFGT
jgi:hypothetical protein